MQEYYNINQGSRRRSSLAQIQGYVEDNAEEGGTEFVFKPKQRRGSRLFLPPLAKPDTFIDGSLTNLRENESAVSFHSSSLPPQPKDTPHKGRR